MVRTGMPMGIGRADPFSLYFSNPSLQGATASRSAAAAAARLFLPPLLMLFLTSLIVESPRWLLQKNKKKLAVLSLIRVRPRKAQAEVEFKAIEATFPRYRTPIPHYLVALLVMVVQQLSGVNTMILSTTTNLAGLDLGASSLDSLILLSVVQAIFVAGYSAGLGPVPWMLAAELTPLRGSGLEMGTVCALNWTGVFATATLLSEVTSAKLVALTLWVHGGLTAAGGALAYTLMPETANLSIEAVLKLRQVGQKYRRKGSSKKRPDSDAAKSDARPKLQNESAEEKTSPQEPAIDSTDEQAERRTRSQEPTEGSKASTMSTPLREPKDGADTKGDDASPGSGSAADADRTDRTTPSPSGTSEPPSKKSLTDGALCYPCCKAAPVANSKGPEGAKRRRHSVASGKSTMTKGESMALTASRSASGASGIKVPDAIAGSENPPGTGGHECSVASRKSTTSRPSTYSKTNAKKKRPSDSTVTETSVKTKDRSSISGTNPDRPSSAAAALGQGSSEGKSRQVTRRRAVEATTSSAASSYRSARQAM
ncbi:hypothetical protein HPB48_012190 [Haemaphysalis longicornis]|uniref:Uncharacterized protein n=1 Tax=Haemaphysalis longicornis TaxID=44386 RepID=A0A9J6GTR3_HAELO|nr:hypothetical protein HPB48_012190 [Haemaphysalis longicornis]